MSTNDYGLNINVVPNGDGTFTYTVTKDATVDAHGISQSKGWKNIFTRTYGVDPNDPAKQPKNAAAAKAQAEAFRTWFNLEIQRIQGKAATQRFILGDLEKRQWFSSEPVPEVDQTLIDIQNAKF